ncbi:hypothetical protein CHS0354_017007 [Potamilus streckersoni]|uniref:Uncharacterized protein n=1 Tax=Potamilus streckersoni TaxID=2493646 RepID=A0AAE0VR83_9BIVA|nr:hypothetical protein CHS0354_017007 [Potamilus streckersoni]
MMLQDTKQSQSIPRRIWQSIGHRSIPEDELRVSRHLTVVRKRTRYGFETRHPTVVRKETRYGLRPDIPQLSVNRLDMDCDQTSQLSVNRLDME